MRLVVDTNVLVSAFLWQGTPGRLIELADEKEIALYTTRALIDELAEVLHRKKLSKPISATGLTAETMVRNYRRLATLVTARQLGQPVSRDVDDDAVLACASAAESPICVTSIVISPTMSMRISSNTSRRIRRQATWFGAPAVCAKCDGHAKAAGKAPVWDALFCANEARSDLAAPDLREKRP